MVVGDSKTERSTALLQRSELLDSYQKNVVGADPNSRENGYKHIEPFVITFLSEMEHQRKLSRQLLDILDASVKEIPGWTPQRGHETFKRLERYAHHMLDAPWKSEFKTMKIFSGFFKVYIEPNLRKAEDIFYMIGYEVQKDSNGRVLDSLILQKPINRRTLAFIASECYFAAIECVIMYQIIQRTDMLYRVQDVYKSRVNCTGGVIKCVKWLTENCVPNSNINGSLQSVKEEEENEWTRQIEKKRQSRSLDDLLGRRTSQPAKTPELRRGDSDDTSRCPHPLSTHMKDWAESNLSNLYNGDDSPDITSILRPKRQDDGPGRDSGYGSHYIAEMTDPGPSISEMTESHISKSHILPDEVDHVLKCNDLYSSGGQQQPNSQPNNSHASVDPGEEYDMYQAGTSADHVQRSLKFIEKIETSPKKSSRPQSSPGCADDWSHITDSLRKEYGDKYFEGDRGCILKQSGSGQPGQVRKSLPVELQNNTSSEGNVTHTNVTLTNATASNSSPTATNSTNAQVNAQAKNPPPTLPKPPRSSKNRAAPEAPPRESSRVTAGEPAREAAGEPAKEIAKEPVKDAVKENAKEHIKESEKEPVQEAIKESIREEPIRESQPSNEPKKKKVPTATLR